MTLNKIKLNIREVIDAYSRTMRGYIPIEEREKLVNEIYYATSEGTFDKNGTVPFRRADESNKPPADDGGDTFSFEPRH